MKASSDDMSDEINVEYILTDVLDVIFRNLKIRDLNNASLVCKSWRKAMLRELSKRGPYRLLIPISNKNNKLCNLMTNKPYLTLLFIAPITRQMCSIKRDILEIVKRCKDSCPDYLIAIGVHYAFIDEIDVTITPDLSGTSHKILGIFLPRYKDLKIRVGYHPDFYGRYDVDKLFEDFFPDDGVETTTVILFTQAYEDNSVIMNLMKHRFKQTKTRYTLWGGSFFSGLLPLKNKQIDVESEREFSRYLPDFGSDQPNGVFATSISGTRFKSWSTLINCRMKKCAVEQKLLDFQRRLNLEKHSMGFLCGPGDVYDDKMNQGDFYHKNPEDFVKAVKMVFHDIPFIAVFDVIPGSIFYGIDDSMANGIDDVLEHKMTLSLLIISYD